MPHIFQRQHVWLRSSLRSLRARRAAGGSARGDDQRELLTVQLATIRAWRDGYLFHQESLRKNTDLLSWVLRESYAL